ncbi:MAG: HIT family protein [Phycisphaerae bacterium]
MATSVPTQPAYPTDGGCIFCKIVAGQIPCYKVYEDAQMLAFLDIGPIVAGHTLLIPKGHYASILDVPEAVSAALGAVLPRLARAVCAAAGVAACHVLTNAGAEASQSVGHLHYHILPRRAGDGYHLPWPAGKVTPERAAELVRQISAQMR